MFAIFYECPFFIFNIQHVITYIAKVHHRCYVYVFTPLYLANIIFSQTKRLKVFGPNILNALISFVCRPHGPYGPSANATPWNYPSYS